MKYIKSYKIFESLISFPTNKEEIDEICLKYNIKDYTINDDLTIDVNIDVSLFGKRLTKLPLKFNKINGNFDCGNNELTSLEGCPKEVNGNFFCSNNQLTSLKGCPKEVSGNFSCSNNQLTSLEGCPNYVGATESRLGWVSGNFYCNDNQLTNLEGCPKEISGDFYFYNNQLVNLFSLTKEPLIYDNNPCWGLYQTCLDDLNIDFEELNFRLEEFNCFKDNELDLVSLENLYEFYNIEFNENKF